jgi:3-dehydroquinate synthase
MESSTLVFGTQAQVPCHSGMDCEEEVCKHLLSLNADKLFVITDATVEKLHGTYLDGLQKVEGGPTVVKHFVPCGDACKCWDVMAGLVEWLFASKATKQSVVVAWGGGAVLNVSGLVASMVFRGLKYVQLPTTLLAMHDVTTSLKTSICFQGRKNNIGTYYAPALILIDVAFCRTLPPAELFSGLGELAKNAAFFGAEHAEGFVEAMTRTRAGHGLHPKRKVDGTEAPFHLEDETLERLVRLGIRAKMTILADDAYEKKFGMIFEYGHTVSHALEKAYGDGTIPHGLGVAYGMSCCAYVSNQLGLMRDCDRTPHDRLCDLLIKRWPLPEPRPTADRILALALRDSKRGIIGEKPHEIAEVLLHRIGEPVRTPSMLSAFDSRLFWDWLLEMGFPQESC